MNGYNFTEEVRTALGAAREAAASLRHEYVGTEHILIGLCTADDSVATGILRTIGVDPREIIIEIETTVQRGKTKNVSGPDLPYTSRAKKVLELASHHARELGHAYVGPEHILLGLISEGKGIAAQVLVSRGVTFTRAFDAMLRLMSSMPAREQVAQVRPDAIPAKMNAVSGSGRNFTERVRKVLMMAREEAVALGHEYVGTEHILLGVIREGQGIAATVIQNLDPELQEIVESVRTMIAPGRSVVEDRRDLPYTSGAKKVIELSMREARELNHSYVGTEHLLLGLIAEGNGIAAQVLISRRIGLEAARDEMLRILGVEMPPRREIPETVLGVPSIAGTKPVGIELILRYTNGARITKEFRSITDAVSFLNTQ